MGKTETIRKRRVDVYLRSEQQKERWIKYAEKQKTSLSKVIINTMESLLSGGLLDQLNVKERLNDKNQELLKENEIVKTNNHRLERYIDILEKELSRSKNITFTEPGPGFRFHNDILINVLKEAKTPVSNDKILTLINVNPAETDHVKGVSNQLDTLSSYGLIKYTSRGWTWIG